MTWKYLKLESLSQVSSISELSRQKNKFVHSFFGRSYGSTIFTLIHQEKKNAQPRYQFHSMINNANFQKSQTNIDLFH